MIKRNDRFVHGEHNEEVCEYLNLKIDYTDWVITTAFYSALHFVSSKIFPFKKPALKGEQTTIENIDQYFNYSKAKNKNISKHELLLELIDEHFKDKTYEWYDWLLSTATTARYSHYQYDRAIAQRALVYLRNIKKSCSSHSGK